MCPSNLHFAWLGECNLFLLAKHQQRTTGRAPLKTVFDLCKCFGGVRSAFTTMFSEL